MASVERLWTDQELRDLNDTVINLRRIRTAATAHLQDGPVNKLFSRFRDSQPPTNEDRQIMLLDAEVLAAAAGDFFATKISRVTNGQVEKQGWLDALSDTRASYKKVKPTTAARTKPIEVADIVVDHLRALSIDPMYVLNWELFTFNNVGATDIAELIKGHIGIISPLSGDFLVASTYCSYLDQINGKSFPLKPSAPTRNLEMVVLPVDEHGKGVFEDLPEVAIYLDVYETGNTGLALIRSLKEAYPSHVVHEPDIEVARELKFEPSKKMQDFWEAAKK